MREEKDSMGTMQVPHEALYGASTQRAVLNFPISNRPMPKHFVQAVGILKYACAHANQKLGKLSPEKAKLIEQAAKEVAEGKLMDHFPVDIFQTGSCTSTNMNANEVIANRVNQLKGLPIGSKEFVHANDDVNCGQSSNDTMPSALHISIAMALKEELLPALTLCEKALDQKVKAWKDVVKIGRTHLMDATPLTLGQEFSGYLTQIKKAKKRTEHAINSLGELAIGGTAVGTGINCHPDFAKEVCNTLSKETGIQFFEAENHFEAQASRDTCVEVAGILSTLAASVTKIANDIRLLGSGPRAGLSEINIPATQPGSSIMPGKVNPVMSEMLVQVGIYVMGMSNMVMTAGRDGHFELNVTIPLIAHALLESTMTLSNGIRTFTERCIEGLEANQERCQELVDRSLMLVTALNPHIGYDKAAEVAKEAFSTNKTLRDVVLTKGYLDESTLDKALDPATMTKPSA